MLNLKHQIAEHPYFSTIWGILIALVDFSVKSWSVNILLLIFLFVSIGINSWSGVSLAKKKGVYELKILKEKALKKVLGYILFLIALWFLIMCVFVSTLNDLKPIVSPYYLNIPMTTCFLFFSGVEFLSTKDNLMEGYGIRTPSSVVERVENLVGSGGKDADKIIQKP